MGTNVNAVHAFFISNTFISNASLKLPKKIKQNAKQHPEAELVTFENHWHSSSRY